MQSSDFELLRNVANGRMVPDTRSSFESGRLPLSIRDMNQWDAAFEAIEHQPVPLVVDHQNAKPVFVAVFDGTWNDREGNDGLVTVPGLLSRELEASETSTRGLQVKYYPGVGTQGSMLRRWWEGATGSGTVQRAERALADLHAFKRSQGSVPHVYVIGFSRGAASARHFLNLAEPMLEMSSTDRIYNRSRSFALIFDTVATGQLDALQLGIPTSTAFAVQFVASHERRLTFPLVSLLPARTGTQPGQRTIEVQLPGVHSDLGGGYGAGLETLSLAMARRLLVRQGFALREQRAEKQAILNMGRHNSDWPGTRAGNGLRRVFGETGRKRFAPKSATLSSSPEDFPVALLERSMREAAANAAEFERVKERNQGEPAVFDGLSIQLERRGDILVLITNCPQHAAFDQRSRWLLLDGQPFLQFTERAMLDLRAGQSYLSIFDRMNPGHFKPAAIP